MRHGSLVVDLHHVRCSECKVALRDELATHCPVCGRFFEDVVSNHVGLARKLQRKRHQTVPDSSWTDCDYDRTESIDLIGS